MSAWGDWWRGRWLCGPWRALPVLGVTQIIAWGAIFYSPALTAPLIAAERGWSLAFTMGGFSLALLAAGVVSPRVGAAIDRFGGHGVMTGGSLTCALGLVALASSEHRIAYLAAWTLIGAGLAASLYDPAFATLGRIFGPAARRPISLLTLAGGFASTIGWPVTHLLLGAVGWRGTYLIYAAALALVCAPLHAFALPRTRAATPTVAPPIETQHATPVAAPPPLHPAAGLAFVLVAAAFAIYAFVPSALSTQLLPMLDRSGLEPSTVVAIGMLFGPAQVAARTLELAFGLRLHPLIVARFAVALLMAGFAVLAAFGVTVLSAAAFAVLFGAANGLLTIARGTVPLALFGSAGYGHLLGRIAAPFLLVQALAPTVVALIVERWSDVAGFAVIAIATACALACFALIRRPR